MKTNDPTTHWHWSEHLSLLKFLTRWMLIAGPIGAVIGSFVALFLWLLDLATNARWDYPWLLYLLPLAGIAIGAAYAYFGKNSEAGNNLIIDEIHEPGGGVPARMTPLVLLGTVVTHLFGGSAGREGTAVQMGGSIASQAARWMKLNRDDTRLLLMAGVAGGFGAVFGTPIAGAIFALEVLAIGRMRYDALIPCLIASIVGDAATTAWHIHHTAYHIASLSQIAGVSQVPRISWMMLGKVTLAGGIFGIASVIFAELTHATGRVFKSTIRSPLLRPAIGGAIIIGLTLLLGTRSYLGIGVVADSHHPSEISIVSSFFPGGATPLSWWWKILFTAITLGSGFKGGEVTPLFFIGATLGNSLSHLLGAPTDLLAGLGFVAVFAGATNTPLACTIMGIELFGAGIAQPAFASLIVYLAVACFVAYFVSGKSGIYIAQRRD